MKLKNLEKVLDDLFGPFGEEKDLIIDAAMKDIDGINKVDSSSSKQILEMFNDVFNKKSRVVSKKVSGRYKEILKYYDIGEIKQAMINASKDDFHIDSNFKYCTLEYFSRLEQIDKWVSLKVKKEEKNKFIMPKFNTKN